MQADWNVPAFWLSFSDMLVQIPLELKRLLPRDARNTEIQEDRTSFLEELTKKEVYMERTDWQPSPEQEQERRAISAAIDMAGFQKRARGLPMMMDSVFCLVGGYLSGNLNDEAFVERYLDEMVPLYKRIAAGVKKELYAECYRWEIDMLHAVSAVCAGVQEDPSRITELYDGVKAAVVEYMSVKPVREKYFIL